MSNILYMSSFDISLGKGPSVNERTFVKALSKENNNTIFYIHGKLTQPLGFELKNSYSFLSSPQRHAIFLPFIEVYKFIVALYLIFFKKIDILIVRVELFPVSIFLLSMLFKNKIYIKTFGGGLMNSLKNKGYKRLNYINNVFFRYILKRAIGIDTVSDSFRNAIVNQFNIDLNKVYVVDNGVDLDLFQKQNQSKIIIKEKYNIDLKDFDIVIGYAGNLSHIRGGQEVVEAVSYLNKAIPSISVGGVICGGGESDIILTKEIELLNQKNNIFLTGNVPFLDMPYFISCLDIGFSILEKKYQGASAQKVRQYVACNVFTITTPGQEEFVEGYKVGKIFQYERKKEINEYLCQLILDKKYIIESPKKLLNKIDIRSKVKERINLIRNSNEAI